MWKIKMKADRAGSIMLLGVGMFLGVLLSFGVSVITAPSEEQVPAFEEIDGQDVSLGSITVYHDNKRNVTCWVWTARVRGGISCIPYHMLPP